MKFEDAIVECMNNGKKVRITGWSAGEYVVYDRLKGFCFYKKGIFVHEYYFPNQCDTAKWEIFTNEIEFKDIPEGKIFSMNGLRFVKVNISKYVYRANAISIVPLNTVELKATDKVFLEE